ncbi:MAG: helix-turn-helix domain-containing protein [Chloroflexota bacterium]
MKTAAPETKGVLNPKIAETKFLLTQHLPAPDLTFFVQRYWIIHWDLSEPYTQATLSYPSVNLVFEKENTRVWGIDSGRFERTLEGKGQVFAVKFRPGAFYPFLKTPISALTDSSISFCDVFGMSSEALEAAMLSLDDEGMIGCVEAFLRERLPERDENVAVVNALIDCITVDRKILKVDDVVARFGMNKRSLQRLFSQYVGVSPKWVIQRCRLQEAAQQLASGAVTDSAKLALELGYFDQAHFIKDFKAVVGASPAEYAKQVGES